MKTTKNENSKILNISGMDEELLNNMYSTEEADSNDHKDFQVKETETEFDKKFNEFILDENKTRHSYIKIFVSFSWSYFKSFFPVSIVYLIYMMINVTNILFVSHSEISKTDKELAYAVNLGLSLYYMFGISICYGLNSSLDTFCTNSYGAKLYYLMGCYLNRALVIMTLVFIPTAVVLFFIKDIMFSLGQSEEVSIQAGNFLRGMLPGMLCFYYTDAVRRFMQAQKVLIPTIFVVFITSLLHPIWVYLFFNVLEMGAFGNGLACSVTNILNFLFMLVLIRKYAHKETFFFFNKDSFNGWKEFFSLAIPSMLMMCLETWNYQIVNFMVGWLKNSVDENTNSYLISFSSIIYMFPFGLSVASANIIGRLVGDFSTKKAEYSTKMIIVFCFLVSCLVVTFLCIFKNLTPYIYTSTVEEIELMTSVLWLYISYQFFEVLTTSYAGIYRGLGMQKIIAVANFICYYLLCLPLSYVLTFVFNMRVYGVWTSYNISIICLVSIYAFIHYKKVDYYKICKEASKRMSRDSFIISSSSNSENTSNKEELESNFGGGSLNDSILSDNNKYGKESKKR